MGGFADLVKKKEKEKGYHLDSKMIFYSFGAVCMFTNCNA